MARYYCSRADVTDMLDSLVGSEISTTAQQDAKLRTPATEWIDSVYPAVAPFGHVPANDPTAWQVNQSDHAASDTTVTIDGGSGDPAEGDLFKVILAGEWDADGDRVWDPEVRMRTYRVTSYATNVLSYEPAADHDFPDNARVIFGPPTLVRQACRFYALALAYGILRKNPLDDMAEAMRKRACWLLGVDPDKPGSVAKKRPDVTYDVWLGGTADLLQA